MRAIKLLMILVMAIYLTTCLTKVGQAAPMGTAFTYQGRLIDANSAADDLYDFSFSLYEANVGGSQFGSDVNKPDVDVIDGYFTVALDFNDVSAFNGDARWLQIGVRPGDQNDPNTYTPLSPRQAITPGPYALWSQKAGTIDVPSRSKQFELSAYDKRNQYTFGGCGFVR